MKSLMIVMVVACGNGGGTGCGVEIEKVKFDYMYQCEEAMAIMTAPPVEGMSYAENKKIDYWNSIINIKCLKATAE